MTFCNGDEGLSLYTRWLWISVLLWWLFEPHCFDIHSKFPPIPLTRLLNSWAIQPELLVCWHFWPKKGMTYLLL